MIVCFSCVAVNAVTSSQQDSASTSTLYFNEPSHDALYIPESLDLTMDYITLQADYMDMLPNEYLSVNINGMDSSNNITFTHDNGENVVDRQISILEDGTNFKISGDDLYATNCVGYFTGDSTISHLSFYLNQYVQPEPSKAGRYTTDVEFEICHNTVTN